MSADRCTLLIVDDEAYILPTLEALLRDDFDVLTAAERRRGRADPPLPARPHPAHRPAHAAPDGHPAARVDPRELAPDRPPPDDRLQRTRRGRRRDQPRPDLLLPAQAVADEGPARDPPQRRREVSASSASASSSSANSRTSTANSSAASPTAPASSRRPTASSASGTVELERLALTDALTGLNNRRAMDDLARFEFKRHARYPGLARRSASSTSITSSRSTSTFLLTGGDAALKGLSRILTASLREVDSVGRMGRRGLPSAAWAARSSSSSPARRTTRGPSSSPSASATRSQSTPSLHKGHVIPLTVSIGFAVAEAGVPADYDEMYMLAAAALAEAKRQAATAPSSAASGPTRPRSPRGA